MSELPVRPDLSDPEQQKAVLAILNEGRGELNARLGVEFVEIGPDRLVATMPVEGNRQPYGRLHGGASASLAETLGSTLAGVNAPSDRLTFGIDLNATHHRGVADGLVTGVCTTVHQGRTVGSYQVAITDEAGKKVCTARLTIQWTTMR